MGMGAGGPETVLWRWGDRRPTFTNTATGQVPWYPNRLFHREFHL